MSRGMAGSAPRRARFPMAFNNRPSAARSCSSKNRSGKSCFSVGLSPSLRQVGSSSPCRAVLRASRRDLTTPARRRKRPPASGGAGDDPTRLSARPAPGASEEIPDAFPATARCEPRRGRAPAPETRNRSRHHRAGRKTGGRSRFGDFVQAAARPVPAATAQGPERSGIVGRRCRDGDAYLASAR